MTDRLTTFVKSYLMYLYGDDRVNDCGLTQNVKKRHIMHIKEGEVVRSIDKLRHIGLWNENLGFVDESYCGYQGMVRNGITHSK